MSLGDPGELEIVVEMLSTDAVQVARRRGDHRELGPRRTRRSRPRPPRRAIRLPEGLCARRRGAARQRDHRLRRSAEEWSSLGHGFRVEAAIVTWQRDDVLQVPVAALFRSGGELGRVPRRDGRAVLTPVEVGRDNGRHAEILGGINPGTTIVLYPGEQVSDGTPVRPRE
jgi:HlyD family secretion protein